MAQERMLGSGNGSEVLEIKRAAIAASSTDNTIVAAVTGKKIRVIALFLDATAALTARFESGTGGTALTGQMALAANQMLTLPFSHFGWFETAAGELLNLELSASAANGFILYAEM